MIFCVLYLKRNVCPQLVETTLLRWRAEKSPKHYSRSLLAWQLGAVNGPTAIGLDKYSRKPGIRHPSSTEDDGYRSYQTDSQLHRQQERRADRWTDWQTEIARQLRWCQPKFRGVEERKGVAPATVQGRHHLSQFLNGTWKIIFICRTLIWNGRPFSSLFSLACTDRKTS